LELLLANSKRSIACPNGSFQEQLSLFEKLGCKVDQSHPAVKELLSKKKEARSYFGSQR